MAVSDLASYRLRWRVASPPGSDQYVTVPAGNSAWDIVGLTAGTDYQVWISAKNDSNHQGAEAGPVVGRPTLADGDPLPSLVANLTVKRWNGSDLRLDWTAPTTDFRGNPTSIARWRIYRATIFPLNVGAIPRTPQEAVVDIPTAATTSWIDPGAYSSPYDYEYAVVAIDGRDLPSGASTNPPSPVAGVTLRKDVANADFDLSWTSVGLSTAGLPSTVVSYGVYASTDPAFYCDRLGHSNRLGTVAAAATCHAGARFCNTFTTPGSTLFFRIVAVDETGNEGP